MKSETEARKPSPELLKDACRWQIANKSLTSLGDTELLAEFAAMKIREAAEIAGFCKPGCVDKKCPFNKGKEILRRYGLDREEK